MNSSSHSLILSSESASKLMNKLHSMPWLKQNSCNSPKQKMSQDDGNCGERSFRSKKTDEDYFSGTREEKKGKKIRKKKDKIVFDVNNLDQLVQVSSEKVISNLEKESERSKNVFEKTKNGLKTPSDSSAAVVDPSSNSVWSTNGRVADVLFPNVQSVIIDRTEEEEMLSRALAESIATVQLEQFQRNSPKEEEEKTSWDALYGDDDDDGGWDNVRINLPVETERTIPRSMIGDIRGKKNWCTKNNTSSKAGILRNKGKELRRSILSSENLDFGFKKTSDNSDEEIKRVQSSKSVAFGETVAIEIEPAEDYSDESKPRSNGVSKVSKANGEPVIDKFGRIDGYSERRLFMGKGARLKEQLYIENMESIEKTLKEEQKITPIIVKENTEDIVEEAKRSPLKSDEKKPSSKQSSLDRDPTVTGTTEAIVSRSSVEKFDKKTTEKAIGIRIDAAKRIENKKTNLKMGLKGSEVESKKVKEISRCEKSIEKAKKIQINITSTFHDLNGESQADENGNIADRESSHTTNVDKKIEKEDLTVENPVSFVDAPESRATQKDQDREADRSTVTDSKQEECVSKLASENLQTINPVSGITEMAFSPPNNQDSISAESSYREQYLSTPNVVRDDLNLENYQSLNNHIEWQSYQHFSAHKSSSNYEYNNCPIPNHLQIPPNVHPYLVYNNVPHYFPYSSNMLATHPLCEMPCHELEAGRSVSLSAINCTKSSSSSANAKAENRTTTNRFMAAQPEPEYVSVPDLPPGFTRRKSAQKNCVDNCGRTFSPCTTTQKLMNNSVSRNVNMRNNSSTQNIEDRYEQRLFGGETMPEHLRRGTPPGIQNQHSNNIRNRESPCQSFGVYKSGKKNHWNVDADWKSNFGNNSKLHIPGQTPQDNYFASNTHSPIPGFHQFAVCNTSLQSGEYIAPYSSFTHCHVPDQYPLGPCGNIPKWQFSMNSTNLPPTPLQTRPIPGYSPPIQYRFGNSEIAAPNLNLNRSKGAMGNIFSDVKISRGRGRLTQRDFM